MTHSFFLRTALAALVTVLPACATARRGPTPTMNTVACAAVAAAIDSLVVGSAAVRVGLRDETAALGELAPATAQAIAELPGIDSTTMRSFHANNARALPACRTLPLVGGMTPLAARDLEALPHAVDYWTAFHERFPGVAGVTSTSGVGIGRDGRQALLMLDHSCGGVCGAGHVVLLERDDEGRWRVKRAVMTWIS